MGYRAALVVGLVWSTAGRAGEVSVAPDLAARVSLGYETNLNHAGEVAQQLGDTSALATATAALWLTEGRHLGLAIGAAHRSTVYLQLADLSSHQPGGWVRAAWTPWPWLSVALAPQLSWVLQGDPQRDGLRFDARASVRVRPREWLTARAGYAFTHREAAEPVFAYDNHQLGGSLEVRALTRLTLSLGYGLELGTDLLYQSVPLTADGTGASAPGAGRWQGARRSSVVKTFGPTAPGTEMVAVQVPSANHGLWAAADLELPAGFALGAFYRFTAAANAEVPYQNHLISLELSWALP